MYSHFACVSGSIRGSGGHPKVALDLDSMRPECGQFIGPLEAANTATLTDLRARSGCGQMSKPIKVTSSQVNKTSTLSGSSCERLISRL